MIKLLRFAPYLRQTFSGSNPQTTYKRFIGSHEVDSTHAKQHFESWHSRISKPLSLSMPSRSAKTIH